MDAVIPGDDTDALKLKGLRAPETLIEGLSHGIPSA
jgi:hypothetical protein